MYYEHKLLDDLDHFMFWSEMICNFLDIVDMLQLKLMFPTILINQIGVDLLLPDII